MNKPKQEKEQAGLLQSLFLERMQEVINEAVSMVRDNVKEDALKDVIGFDENPYIDRVFSKMTYVDQRNDLRQTGKDKHQAEFKMFITVVD